jgi:hypothetical protein
MKTPVFAVAGLSQVLPLLVGLFGSPFVALAQTPTLNPIRSFTLPIAVGQVVGHPDGQHLFVVEQAGNRVVKVALGDGRSVAGYEFPHRIARIVLTPDGRRLYAGLVTLPNCCDSREDAPQQGALGEVDLVAGGAPRIFPVAADPFDLVATDTRLVALSTHSGQAADLVVYDAAAGTLVGRVPLHARSLLALHPNQRTIYAAEGESASYALQRLDLAQPMGDPTRSASVSMAEKPQMWFLPGGERLATQDNRLYQLRADPAVDLQPLGRLPGPRDWCFDLVAAPASGVLYRLSEGLEPNTLSLDEFNLAWFTPLKHHVVAGGLAKLLMTSYGLCLVHWSEPTRVEFYEAAGVNTPPVARFTVSPTENITTFTDVRLDASLSTDTVDTLGAGLSFRWDLDGDGTFDTPFETNAVRTLRPSKKGTWNIGLEVQDQFEARDRTLQTIEVTADTDPGLPAEPHTPWVLDGDVWGGVFDGANGWFYASELHCGLLKVSLATGLAVRRWSFGENRCSGALAWVPELGRLYVAIWGVGGDDNYIAEFDLAAEVKVREFRVLTRPRELAASATGLLAIHNTDGTQSNELAIYRGTTGERLDQLHLNRPSGLAIHPGGQLIVAQGEWVDTVALDPATGRLGLVVATGITMAGQRGGKPVFLPGGTNVLFVSGSLYSCTPEGIDPTVARYLGLSSLDAAVPMPGPGLLALINYLSVGWLHYPGLTWLVERSSPVYVRAAGEVKGRLAVARFAEGHTTISLSDPPAVSPEQNHPPSVTVTQPTDQQYILAPSAVVFEAIADDDDGAVRAVTFVIDGNDWYRAESQAVGQRVFGAVWQQPTLGEHTIQARAEDNWGAPRTSLPVRLIYDSPPVVRFLTPAEFQPILTPTNVLLEVDAQDPGGRVVRVDFFFTDSGGPDVALGSLTDPPYRLTLTNFMAFDGAFRAEAVDDRGLVGMYTMWPALRGPEGDDYRRPFLLTGTRVTAEIANDSATDQLGEPMFRDPTIPNSTARTFYHSLWWSWVAPTGGVVTLSTAGSSFDTLLIVRDGATLVAGNDDAVGQAPTSWLKFVASRGVNYLLGVGGSSAAEAGRIRLGLELSPLPDTGVPPNDRFVNRTILPSNTNVIVRTGYIGGATADAGEPAHAGSPARHSVWWSWRSPGPGRITLSTEGSDFDTVLAVYRGTSFGSIVPVAANDDAAPGRMTSLVAFDESLSAPTYSIAVDGFVGAVGQVVLEIRWEPLPAPGRPPNDDFAAALRLDGDLGTWHSSNLAATVEPEEPAHAPGTAAPSHSVWWGWTALRDGPVYFIATADFPHALAAYTGDRLEWLDRVGNASSKSIAAKSQRTVLVFLGRKGTRYRLAFDSLAGTGSFDLSLNASLPLDQPLLLVSAPDPDGTLTLHVRIGSPDDVLIERSADLRTWGIWGVRRVEEEIAIQMLNDGVMGFFRGTIAKPGR